MPQKKLAETLISHYKRIANNKSFASRCFIGFDGVTDEIVSAVQTRVKADQADPFLTIAAFGERILEASEKSGNIELIVKQKKIGGNGPILAEALLKGGHRITLCGTIGTKQAIEPLFASLAAQCEEAIPLGPSAHSDAIEFEDGKIILGKIAIFNELSYQTLIDSAGAAKLKEILERSELFISANWTMILHMNEIWRCLLKDIIPFLTPKKRLIYVDLADPAKRTDADLREALSLLKAMSAYFYVIQGLNEAEALRVAKTLALPPTGNKKEDLLGLASRIREKSGLQEIVIHATHFACCAHQEGSWLVDGPYTPKPVLTTGAGDNFNAGYCNAVLYGLSREEALLSGVATSGFYVRYGHSPTMEELKSFLLTWLKT